ncbi:hypothetical protein TheetDRAFT_2423 [Thermoanaerobacter ethanolicus JW 200]|nr:hypothetical protein TheetDRAFT_2423 [Thermoanaerobacter ethanolicus JW 200]
MYIVIGYFENSKKSITRLDKPVSPIVKKEIEEDISPKEAYIKLPERSNTGKKINFIDTIFSLTMAIIRTIMPNIKSPIPSSSKESAII